MRKTGPRETGTKETKNAPCLWFNQKNRCHIELPKLGELAKMENIDRTDNGDYCLEGDWVGLSFHIRTSVPVLSQEETRTRI